MTGVVELAMAGAKVQNMANELTDLEAGEEEKQDEGPCGERTLKTRIAQGVAGASIVINIIAMAISPEGVVIVAGIIALIIAAIVISQQFKLQDTGSMREAQNKLRKDVNKLQQENNKFASENTRLEGQVSLLKEQEARLELITAEQGSNVNQLVKLVNENKEIQTQMMGVVKEETVQALINAILQSDRDSDMKISGNEIRMVMVRLENLRDTVKVDEEKLTKFFAGKDLTLDGLFIMIKELDTLPEEERVFQFL